MQKQAVKRTVCAWWFTDVAYLKTNNKTLSLVSGNEDKSTDNRQEMLSLVGSVSSCSEMHLVGLNDGLLTFPKMATGPTQPIFCHLCVSILSGSTVSIRNHLRATTVGRVKHPFTSKILKSEINRHFCISGVVWMSYQQPQGMKAPEWQWNTMLLLFVGHTCTRKKYISAWVPRDLKNQHVSELSKM